MLKKLQDRILEYGIYLLVFLLPLQTRFIFTSRGAVNGFVEYNAISLYFIDILIIGLVILWFINFFTNKNVAEFKSSFLWFILAGLDLILLISVLMAGDSLLAFYKYLVFLMGLGFFWLILKVKYRQRLLWLFFGLSVLLQAFLGLWQFLFQMSPASKWLGMARHYPGDLGASVIETFGSDGVGERWLRAYGSLDHPNMFGALLAISILVALFYLAKQKVGNKTLSENFYLLIYLVSVTAIVFSFSRSSWLGLFLAILFLVGSLIIRKQYFIRKNILKNILIASVLALVLFTSYNNLFITRIKAVARLEIKSQDERRQYRQEAMTIIDNNLLLGTGIGNYVSEEINHRPSDDYWTFQPVHNTFLLILAEVGVLGLSFFVAFLFWVMFKSIKKRDFFNLTILVSLFSMMMFDHFWWSLHFGIIFFWFIMGILVKRIYD